MSQPKLMNPLKFRNLLSLLFILRTTVAVHAGPRTSASYRIVTDTSDAGGKRTASASYSNDGSVGGASGLATVATPTETAKSGYVGQLYDVTGLTLTAVSPNVNEGATDQLGAWQALDDATFLTVPAASVAWSVASGPLSAIDASGLATAGAVYQDTAATAQGSYAGDTGTLALTVKNVSLDNFGSYVGDGLDDAWQVLYFGFDNPLAALTADPDGDSQSNAFEYTAGLIPNDANSRFTLTIAAIPGQPTQKNLIFTPRLADRTYTVVYKTSLAGAIWTPLPGGIIADNGSQRTVTDPSATGEKKFYQIEISRP